MGSSSDELMVQDLDKLRVPEIRKLARKIAKENKKEDKLLKLSRKLLSSKDRNKIRLGINLLLLLSTKKSLMRDELEKLADNEDWELREEAAQVIRNLLEEDFNFWFPTLKEFISSSNINLQRAAVVGSMATGITDKVQVRKIVEGIYEPVLESKDKYIRINLGPFAFGAFLVRLFPQIAFEFFDKWIKSDDEWTKWNVLMAFSASRGKEYPDKAKYYIGIVKNDKSLIVQGAIKSVSKRLTTKTPVVNR